MPTPPDTMMAMRAHGPGRALVWERVPVTSSVRPYALADANQALDDLRQGRVEGAAVLLCQASAP